MFTILLLFACLGHLRHIAAATPPHHLPPQQQQHYPVPSSLPSHEWTTVGHQLFIHGCKADGLFNQSELALAARYPLMTVEKGQGLALPGYADDKMAAIAAQWKEGRRALGMPPGWALFYINAHFDWPFFAIHKQMEAHPTWPVQKGGAISGDPCLQHGDHSFPQPSDGMLLFNHSHAAVRAAFVHACVNATNHGFDGCFIDSAAPPTASSAFGFARQCNTSVADAKAVEDGKVRVMAELQQAVGDGHMIVAKDSYGGGSEQQVNTIFPLDTFCSCYSCNWTSTHNPPFRHSSITYADVCQTQIKEAIRLGRRGQAVLLHGEVNQQIIGGGTAAAAASQMAADDFQFALAAFLIAASDSSFFGYSDGWYFNGTRWHAEYDRALGSPTGLAVQGAGAANMSWSRTFGSGTRVELDVLHKTAEIRWASAAESV
jgi:hypothetical protein